ncbi:MAG: serine hydrolase domain-containing protein [Gemmatimonadaceae bacterium]
MMRTSHRIPFHRALLALVALPAFMVAPAQAQSPQSGAPHARLHLDTARVDSVFAGFDRRDSPGCALGIIRDGRTLYARGYGMADLERGVPITPRTVFDIGSTSKQFTAASLALLAADGRLSLDDDVRKYIPELPQYGTPITLLNLLQHTSGLRDYIGVMNLAGMRFEDVTTDEDALAAITRQKALNFRPGTEHDYSNSGYFLASVVVQRASGMSLARFARERIFVPLGMTSTLFRDDYASLVPHRAVAYAPADSGRFTIDMSDWEQTGDGAVHTTVEDLARWDQNFYTPTVGGPRLLERLLTPGRLSNGEPLEYALGLFIDQYRGLRRVHHGGAWAGYRADMHRFPDQRVSVVVLCNLGTSNPSRLADRVVDVILADHLQPAAAGPRTTRAAAAAPEADTREAAAAPLELAQYTGTYFDERTNGLRRVAVDSGRLVLRLSGTALPMRALGGGRFRSAQYPITIAFRRPREGASPHLEETIGGGRPVTYAPVAAASLTPGALSAYAGTYHSEELATVWTIAPRDSGLVLMHRALDDPRLEPAFADALTAGPVFLRFTRDAGGHVTGFAVSIGRARNIGFVRRGS